MVAHGKRLQTVLFLVAEAVLYVLILTSNGKLLRACQFSSIVLCFLYSAFTGGNRYITAALVFTVGADYFLVAHPTQLRLAGMVFFLGTQFCYGMYLHKNNPSRLLLALRGVFTLLAVFVAFAVLGKGTDALALVSLCYYANLLLNIAAAFCGYGKNSLLAFALVLFMLCDTVVGLQAASEGYLSIAKDSALYRLLFMPFSLSWFFYLPSQVLCALSGREKYIK